MIALRLLGSIDLRDAHGEPIDAVLRRPKLLALLAYLAIARPRGFHRRDKLVAMFWPESSQARARHALRQAIYALRRELGEETIVTRGDEEVGVDEKSIAVDAIAFEDPSSESTDEAVADLYHGALLDGFHLVGSPEFERWAELEKARLHTRALQVMRDVAGRLADSDDRDGAVRWARRAFELAPHDEAVARRLIHLLASDGDEAGALAVYRTLADRRTQDLDLPTSAETKQLVASLRLDTDGDRADEQDRTGVDVVEPSLEERPVADRELSRPRRWIWPVLLGAGGATLVAAALWVMVPERASTERIAVLPFTDLSNDTGQAYFVDGMHEAIITELAQIRALTVISRSSVLRYRDRTESIPEIARALDVDAVLEGSVLRVGDTVRIQAQLIATDPERHLWARTYDGTMNDVLGLHRQVARAIAEEMQTDLTPRDVARLARSDSVKPQVYEAYLRGVYHRKKLTPDGLTLAAEYFNDAIALDSSYALAYVGLADTYRWRGAWWGDLSPAEAFPIARTAVERALALDSALAEGYAVLGSIRFQFYWDWAGAEAAFTRAVELNPNSADVHGAYSNFLRAMRRLPEGLVHARRAAQLDPLTPRSWAELYLHFAAQRRWTEAEQALAQAVELDPRAPPTQLVRGLHFANQGDYESGAEAFGAVGPLGLPLAAILHVRLGRRDVARRLLDRASDLPQRFFHFSAWAYAALGDSARALDLLEQSFRAREANLVWLNAQLVEDPDSLYSQALELEFWRLRNTPRFQAVVERMAFPKEMGG